MSIPIDIVPNTISVSYEEIHGSRREFWGDENIVAQRKLKCAWDDRHDLAAELRGYLRNSGGGNVQYMQPQSFPGYNNLFVKSVTIEPFNPGPIASTVDTTVLEYDEAELLVEYENIGNLSDTDDDDTDELNEELLITESLQTSVEFLTVSNRKLSWDAGGTEPLEIDESPGIMVYMLEWIYTVHHMPYIPEAAISYTGYVNSTSVYSPSLDVTFAAETLLYKGCEPSRQVTDMGIKAWEITYRYAYRARGWNKFPKAGGGTYDFQSIYNDSGVEEKPYPSANFNVLFFG